jgi:lipopolysaccharide/colanic/teichoic acid biosynthesis glycosyltransferase
LIPSFLHSLIPLKRVFDIIVSLLILVLFLPFGIIISIWILIESKGGLFYRQERIGKNGIPFKIFKFRSMRKDADKQGKLTVGMRDPRITNSGYFIRKYKLDEFPQFINVLIGEMSIVGPRPEVKEYTDLYNDEQRKILSVKPGITDYASLEYFKENELLGKSEDPQKTYINEIMPAKIQLNLKYIENPGIIQDLKIMWRTFLKIVAR